MNTDTFITDIEKLQNEMHVVMNRIKNKSPFTQCSYDDLVHIFYLMKINELKEEITRLKTSQPEQAA